MTQFLDISEPASSFSKREEGPVIGIDLGTTHSLVACASLDEKTPDSTVDIYADADGHTRLPSIVFYPEFGAPIVGEAARTEKEAVHSIKRLMGCGKEDLDAHAPHEKYRFVGDDALVRLHLGKAGRTPVEVSADILKTLKARAEKALKTSITQAVITVPAYFNDAQRQATRDAARLAGLNPLRLLAEPTAAALAYGLNEQPEMATATATETGTETETKAPQAQGIFMVYDLGGGTFDVSVLKLTQGVFRVLATGGDGWLGGDDIDQIIATHKRCSLATARNIKEQLTFKHEASVHIGGEHYALKAGKMAELITPLIEKTIRLCRETLKEAGAPVLDGIVLAGGSTRMPLVQKAVEEAFLDTPVHTHMNPDEIVAIGAALQARALSGAQDAPLLLDVTPLSLGLETVGGLVEKIIPRNTPLPMRKAQEFTTFKENQSGMDIHIVQGERETVEGCRSLAKFTLKGIPPLPAGQARVKVAFTLDADGLLFVEAREETTGISQQIDVNPSYGLTEEEILSMLKENFANASEDVAVRRLLEAKTELERVIDACTASLKGMKGMEHIGNKEIKNKENEQEDCSAASLHHALEQAQKELHKNTNPEELSLIAEKLDETFRPLATRRMNAALKSSIVGKKLSDFNGSHGHTS